MQKQFVLDTRIAPEDTIEVKEGAKVRWRHVDGTQLTGTVEKHFGARLWHVASNDGTKHVVGSWILESA